MILCISIFLFVFNFFLFLFIPSNVKLSLVKRPSEINSTMQIISFAKDWQKGLAKHITLPANRGTLEYFLKTVVFFISLRAIFQKSIIKNKETSDRNMCILIRVYFNKSCSKTIWCLYFNEKSILMNIQEKIFSAWMKMNVSKILMPFCKFHATYRNSQKTDMKTNSRKFFNCITDTIFHMLQQLH